MAEIKLKANAKINLYLEVLNKRKDGYHNIKTVFQEVSLSDDISIREIKSGIKIICAQKGIPTGRKNLAYVAADLIKKRSDICGKGVSTVRNGIQCRDIFNGVEIKIKKNIPAGAGLGGGSSDAAAVLKGLIRLWKLKFSKKQLVEIAGSIGADVPFFIYGGGRCLGEGIGDKLTPLKIKKTQWYVLVKPPFEINTGFAYSLLTKSGKNDNIKKCVNRFEDVIIPLYPEIKKIKEKLVDYGAVFSLMSGSGSCVFGVAENKKSGEKIRNRMKKQGYSAWLAHSIKAS